MRTYDLDAKQEAVKLSNGKCEVPISGKPALTIPGAAMISTIGENKLYSLVRQPRCPFVLYVGCKCLIKRKEFEGYLSENVGI